MGKYSPEKVTYSVVTRDGTHRGRYKATTARLAAIKAFNHLKAGRQEMTVVIVRKQRGHRHLPQAFRVRDVPLPEPKVITRMDDSVQVITHQAVAELLPLQ